MDLKKGTKGGRNAHPNLREPGKPPACPFAVRDGGRSRRETFNRSRLPPPGAGDRLPWISTDGRALAVTLPRWGYCLG